MVKSKRSSSDLLDHILFQFFSNIVFIYKNHFICIMLTGVIDKILGGRIEESNALYWYNLYDLGWKSSHNESPYIPRTEHIRPVTSNGHNI